MSERVTRIKAVPWQFCLQKQKQVEKTKVFLISNTGLFIIFFNHDSFMLWKNMQPLKGINHSVCIALDAYPCG